MRIPQCLPPSQVEESHLRLGDTAHLSSEPHCLCKTVKRQKKQCRPHFDPLPFSTPPRTNGICQFHSIPLPSQSITHSIEPPLEALLFHEHLSTGFPETIQSHFSFFFPESCAGRENSNTQAAAKKHPTDTPHNTDPLSRPTD